MANITTRNSQTLSPLSMFDDIDRLMVGLLGNLRLTVQPTGQRYGSGYNGTFSPQLDVTETATSVEINAELPGLSADDVSLDVTNNILTLQGEKRQENESVQEQKGKTLHRTERTYGQFTRRIALPADVDTDKVNATFKNGVLHITLPKSEKSQPRHIAIKAS